MRRILMLLVLVASTTFALTPPAQAGGPTSVLITDPTTGRASALYYSGDAYAGLERLLADGERLPGEPAGLGAGALNLTWLIHDVEPWQTQQLYLDADGGPVVVTYGSDVMGNADQVTWTRPSDVKALGQLVRDVLSGSAVSVPAPPTSSASSASAPAERVVTETTWWSLAGWRWAVVGLLAGAGAALLVTRSRTRDREPRQVLIDA
jgi:hypothetical protein